MTNQPAIDTITVEVVREIHSRGTWIIRTKVITSDGEEHTHFKEVDPIMFDYDGYWKHTWDKMGEEIKRHIQNGPRK